MDIVVIIWCIFEAAMAYLLQVMGQYSEKCTFVDII